MRVPSVPVVARIPEFAAPGWIAYCTARRLTQSEAIRRGIASLIENDETATNEELVVAAQIEESFPEYCLRSDGKYARRKVRWRGSLVAPVSPSP